MDYISSVSMWTNVLIASSSVDEHIKHMKHVFEHLKKFGVVINPVKCEFKMSEINFLGQT